VLARNVSSVSHRADMSRSSSCSARQGAGAADRPDRAWRSAQVSRQPHFWVTLVKAAKKEAQAKAALLASVQAQQDEMILEASTRATIDALVGEGFSASRTLRDHVKRWADMIRAEYAGDTLRQGSAREGARREVLRHTRSERRVAEGGPSAQGHHRVIATRMCCRCFAS
jgi:hypothetical protein